MRKYRLTITCEHCGKKPAYDADDNTVKLPPTFACSLCKKNTRPLEPVWSENLPQKPEPKSVSKEEENDLTIINEEAKKRFEAYSCIKYPILSELAFLTFEDSKGKACKMWLVDKEKQLVGRNSAEKPSDLNILTEDAKMSRQHFYLEISQEKNRWVFKIKDNGSANGTFIKFGNDWKEINENFVPILQHDTIIKAGRTFFMFHLKPLAE